MPVHCLVVHPNDSARLYVGTDIGVFVTVLPAFGAGPMGVVGASARIEF